ncbi:hypothetical protein U1Q18_018757 [Sarracenia purpurea var. burkii]
MTGNRRRLPPTVEVAEETRKDLAMASECPPHDSELARRRLRQRWELASVLNFLHVFEPVIGSKLKISAEEIETALITSNALLAQLHIALLKRFRIHQSGLLCISGDNLKPRSPICNIMVWVLHVSVYQKKKDNGVLGKFTKAYIAPDDEEHIAGFIRFITLKQQPRGIPPVSKTLSCDAWVTVLCKKLAMWWPWVAEGDMPLTPAKGEEICKYKELDPTTRLLLLKALCEIRADQDDTISYINDALKNGTALSSFRKDKIGGDGNGTTYWYDGNAVIGHRLYKEVSSFESNPKLEGKGNIPTMFSEWETLATSFEEFCKIVDEFSSSEAKLEVAVGKTIETDAIPVLEKLSKKKHRALKQQQRKDIPPKGFRNSGITRSCRNRRPVNYTFEDYDRAINEAIQLTKRRKTTKERKQEENHSDYGKGTESASNGNGCLDLQSDTESVEPHGGNEEDSGNSEEHTDNRFAHKLLDSHWSKKLAGIGNHSVSETKTLGAKNWSRQRPTRNSALESAVVPDSEDEQSSDDKRNRKSGNEKYVC